MARDGIMALLGVRDCVISKLLTDSGSTTYDNGLDVPIQSISLDPDFITAALPGDDKILDRYSKIRAIKGRVAKAKLSLNVINTLMGGTASPTGSTPNEKLQVRLKGTDLTVYFKLEAQVRYLGEDNNAGDFHIILHKCKVTSWSIGHTQDGYAECSFELEAIPTIAGDLLVDFEENETAVALSTTPDTTAPTVSSTSPTDAATGVATSAVVQWTFSEAILYDAGAFELYRVVSVTDLTVVATTKSYDAAAKRVTLTPTSALSSAANYVAIAQTTVTDLAGNRLAAASVINFTTA